MLVIARKVDESITISDTIKIVVISISGTKEVRLGISAPDDVRIVRDDAKSPRPIKARCQTIDNHGTTN